MLSCHCGLDGHRLDCDHYRESTPDGSPAHASGCESPDPSPDCPRCAALTRELANEEQRADVWSKLASERAVQFATAARDLAQARQALRLTVGALEIWENAVGEINVWPLECRKALIAAREALVERGTEQDLGVAQSAPSESSGGEQT